MLHKNYFRIIFIQGNCQYTIHMYILFSSVTNSILSITETCNVFEEIICTWLRIQKTRYQHQFSDNYEAFIKSSLTVQFLNIYDLLLKKYSN